MSYRLPRALLLLLLCLPMTLQAGSQTGYSRIATLDWGLAETLIGIGVTPLAVADLPNYRRWVGEPAMPPEVYNLGLRSEPNLELLAQLNPELILITPQFEAARPLLERIAPVKSLAIYRPDSDPLQTAETLTRELAELTGRQQQAERLISDFALQTTQLRRKLADQSLPPFYLVSFIDDRHVRVYGEHNLFSAVLARLDQRNAWQAGDNVWGFAQTGLERLADNPDAALIYFAPLPLNTERQLANSKLWQQMPFVQQQRVYAFPATWQLGGLLAAQRFMRLFDEALSDD